MFDRQAEVSASALLARARSNRVAANALDVELLTIALGWADAHPGLEPAGDVLPALERSVRIGGEGTPRIAEFAPAELALELDTSTAGGTQLVADALDLRHRLPRLWSRVQAGEVKPWLARRAAQATHRHPLELARQIDAAVAGYADRLSLTQLESLIQATWKRLDPQGAAHVEQLSRTELGVWLSRDREHGVAGLYARLEALDGLRVEAAVQRGADALAALGDTRGQDRRRAAALGIMADPQDALDLYDAHAALAATEGTADQPPHPEPDPALEVDPERMTDARATACRPDPWSVDDGVAVHPSVWRRPRTVDSGPKVMLYVHLTDQALDTGQGVARVEGVGPVTAGLVRDWLASNDARITVRPVLDLGRISPVDGYEVPPRMAEAVRLRTPVDCFPYATSTSRRMDLDHTEPYVPPDDGGPPGQTRTDNLGPLTRQHHRIKTHARGWTVRQVFDGVFVWRTPHGRHYLVDGLGTSRALAAA